MQYKNYLKKITKNLATSLALALALTSLAGCGKDSGKVPSPSAEPIPASSSPEDGAENTEPEETGQDVNENPVPPSGQSPDGSQAGDKTPDEQPDNTGSSAPENNFAPQSGTELTGNVKTVAADSFVVSQSFIMPTEDSDAGIMVAPAEGSPDEVLVTVHVSENTAYKIHTVKNGGVNGDSDVEKTEGSFSDLKEKSSISAQGHYEDNDFWADEIIIHLFV